MSFDLDTHARAIDRDGYTIVADFMDAARLAEVRRVLGFSGTLVHRGGANRSATQRLAFSNQYCQPWARQQENFLLGVPPDVAQQMPARLQEMLGYSIYPPFMGQLTASHPAKALAAGFANPVRAQAHAAGARLPE
jgi:ectoine hydroxylase-related dioxygenase (phytanoyl-CoA dioxygenase family)